VRSILFFSLRSALHHILLLLSFILLVFDSVCTRAVLVGLFVLASLTKVALEQTCGELAMLARILSRPFVFPRRRWTDEAVAQLKALMDRTIADKDQQLIEQLRTRIKRLQTSRHS
jgi:hypothetical protein